MTKELTNLMSFDEYDLIIVSFSGGKDSMSCLLTLLEQGAPRDKIQLWHQDIDGTHDGTAKQFMDWPSTTGYVKKCGEAFGIPVKFQWRVGGFEREMLRSNAPTADVRFENPSGDIINLISNQNRLGTRMMFPQVTANLLLRWCSAYLKIDVCSRAINNSPELKTAKILFVTGERREESAARAKYKEMEYHRCNNKSRLVHHWRPVIDWKEEQIWDMIKRWDVNPNPAYKLGWGRLSCLACIFGGNDQWASVKQIAPATFSKIADYEQQFGKTIHRTKSVCEQADCGLSHIPEGTDVIQALAMSKDMIENEPFLLEPGEWQLPAGAFKACGGPS